MPSVKLYPSIISTVLAWTTPDNAKADDGAYAVTAGTRNSNHDLLGSGFSRSIPIGSTINSIIAEVQYKLSTASSAWTGTLQVQKSATLSGTATTITAEPTTDTLANADGGAFTYSDLANMEVLFRVRRTSNTACNYSVDYIAVTVDYTEPTYNYSGSGTVAGTGSTTGTGIKQTAGTGVTTGTTNMTGTSLKGASRAGTITGTGAITATGYAAETTYDFSGSGAVTGQELCAADGIKQARAPTAVLTVIGSTLGLGVKQSSKAGVISASGSTSGTGNKQASSQGSAEGAGTIIASGTSDVPTYEYSGSGAITGVGDVIGTSYKQSSGTGETEGAGLMAASYTTQRYGIGLTIGTGMISSAGTSRRLYRVDNPHRVQVTRPPSGKTTRIFETARQTVRLKSKHRVVVTLDK